MSGAGKRPEVIFAVTNCICFDQRVMKMAKTVESLGAEVLIVGKYRGKCCENDTVPFRTKRFRMFFRRGFLFYKFFNIRLFFFLLFRKSDIIVSNDLDTLPASWLAAVSRSATLVYDSHEYFTGVPELLDRSFVRSVWQSIERFIFPRLKNIITVSDPIAELYLRQYGIKPVVIRNCSRKPSMPAIHRSELGIDENKLLLVMQGGGINIHKGAEELLEAMKQLTGTTLMIIGSGDVISDLEKMTSENMLDEKIIFLPLMPWDEMMRYTQTADAGLSLERDTNINYRFSLPNKLFDYIAAGIPVIATDLPEISKVVAGNACGIILSSVSPGEIAESVNLLKNNRDLLEVLRQNSKAAFADLNWEKESEKVKELYLNLLKETR
ncbi:MAG TPA: glycosyltransferase family 4 protein [Bacteroidales bacterium]|nr:glycosyltransferase family 4 protein [Bacteroidales bacterium]